MTVDLKQLKKLVDSGYSQSRIAKTFSIPLYTVKRLLRQTKLKTHGVDPNIWSAADEQVLRTQWTSGASLRHISAELGISRSAVVGKAYRLGLPPRKTTLTPRSWLPSDINTLRKLRAQNISQQQCAKVLGRTQKAVALKCRQLGINISAPHRGKSPPNYFINKKLPNPTTLPPREKYILPELADSTDGVAFLECGTYQCKWIIGKQRCCGKPLSKRASPTRHPYCDEHYALAIDT